MKATAKKNEIPAGYVVGDLRDEEYREIVTDAGLYRIDNPVTLIRRPGGATHRVVDANGVVHCYVAPESGKSILRWKPRPGANPVAF